MSAEIIRGVDFKNKKVKGGGEGVGNKNERVSGILSIHFFYKNFILQTKNIESQLTKKGIIDKSVVHHLYNTVNPHLKINKSRKKWAEQSMKNLLRALAIFQSNIEFSHKNMTEEELRDFSGNLKYEIVFGGRGFFRSRIFEGKVGDENDLQRLKEILEPFA